MVLTFIVPTWKFFVFQNFANLEETETACDCC